jgi:hypothetical protein
MESVVQPQQEHYPGQGSYQSNKGLSIAIIVLLAIHAALSVILAFAWPSVSHILDDAGEPSGFVDALSAIAVGFAAIVQGCIFVATAVCFLIWLYRAHRNLPSLGSESVVMTPKSAVVGWFIPFVNFVAGYKSVHHLFIESQPRPTVLPTGYALPRRAPIVGLWWGFYLARNILSRIADSMSKHDMSGAISWLVASEVLDVVAAALCIAIVYRIEKRQHDQHDDLVRRVPAPIPTDRLR